VVIKGPHDLRFNVFSEAGYVLGSDDGVEQELARLGCALPG